MDPRVVAMLVCVGVYPLAALGLVLGMRRLARSRRVEDALAPTVSVVVSARNEERDLPRCIASLLALDYPAGRLQIVLVDDRSTDRTGALIDATAQSNAHVVALHTASLPDNGLAAKARGVAHGFAHATGEWVLITDADAAVPPSWARHMIGAVTPDVTVVGGTVRVEGQRWWGVAERVLNLFLHPVNHGLAGWGVPVVAVGPNMGIRRSVYVARGGLEAAPRRVAEDLTLFHLATVDGGTMQNYLDPETSAALTPVPSPAHLLSQLRRFLGGGVAMGWHYALGLAAAIIWGTVVAGLLLFGWRLALWPWAFIVAAKFVADAWLLSTQARRAGTRLHGYEPLLLQLLQIIILPILAVSLLGRRPIHWRGEGFDDRFA
jgi:cellulose synthase/poly-beta-1,6-N-acetylglucosamine synthase-like glycosyltransferase